MKKYIYIAIFVLVVAGLFYWSWSIDPMRKERELWASNDIDCTAMEGQLQHFHPVLHIFVDGQEEIIPTDIGVTTRCFSEIHTHDTHGTIHIESPYKDKKFILNQFFVVWGKSIEREGYRLSATLDAKQLLDPAKLVLADLQQIVLNYTSIKK